MGRCNMCVHPDFGARSKMAVVFIDLELVADEKIDFGLVEFCKLCGLCGENCPSQAISREESHLLSDERIFWQHKSHNCLEMWVKTGSDCGVCMSSCPFSQGIDPDLVKNMKGNPTVMDEILSQHKEKYGKRNYLVKQTDIATF